MILKPSTISPNNISQDSNNDIVVSWRNNGDRQYYYQITIYRNSDNALAYDSTKLTSFNTFHIVPSNTLINGITYKYRVIVWNQNNQSATSDWIVFKCSSTPIGQFTNLTSGAEILNNNYLFQAQYTQAENVPIRSWLILLYDSNNSIISTSPETFNSNIEYHFYGLNNDSNYFIELQVKSQDNLLHSTGKVSFSVRYEVPPLTIALDAQNVSEKAAVRLQWNIAQIIGQGQNYSYVDNEKVDTRNGKVWFDNGFNIKDNFTLRLWLESVPNKTFNINPNSQIVSHKDPLSNTTVLWFENINQETEQQIGVVVSKNQPNNINTIWIEDENQSIPRELTVSLDINIPHNTNTLWLDLMADMDKLELLKMKNNSDENISLRYYNSAFHLYKNNIHQSSVSANGNSYYLYIQQIENNLILHAEVV